MSKYQLTTIQQVMNFTTQQAIDLLTQMDNNNDHPDWSEATDRQLRSHFKCVSLGH